MKRLTWNLPLSGLPPLGLNILQTHQQDITLEKVIRKKLDSPLGLQLYDFSIDIIVRGGELYCLSCSIWSRSVTDRAPLSWPPRTQAAGPDTAPGGSWWLHAQKPPHRSPARTPRSQGCRRSSWPCSGYPQTSGHGPRCWPGSAPPRRPAWRRSVHQLHPVEAINDRPR